MADEEEWESVEKLSASYNESRIEAFAQTVFQRDQDKRSRLPDLLATLKEFLKFAHGLDQGGYAVYEDLEYLHADFKAIMHKFIFKFGDVDRAMIEDVCGSLLEYYGFLERAGLVPSDELEEFQTRVGSSKQGLLEKMERYNEIRHNDDVDEDEKEAIREELFEGDHAWPHL